MTLDINTILHTKDGRIIGNAIITGREGYHWIVTTDYGNKVRFTTERIHELFYIAFSDLPEEYEGFTTEQAQEIHSLSHKHRVICDQ